MWLPLHSQTQQITAAAAAAIHRAATLHARFTSITYPHGSQKRDPSPSHGVNDLLCSIGCGFRGGSRCLPAGDLSDMSFFSSVRVCCCCSYSTHFGISSTTGSCPRPSTWPSTWPFTLLHTIVGLVPHCFSGGLWRFGTSSSFLAPSARTLHFSFRFFWFCFALSIFPLPRHFPPQPHLAWETISPGSMFVDSHRSHVVCSS